MDSADEHEGDVDQDAEMEDLHAEWVAERYVLHRVSRTRLMLVRELELQGAYGGFLSAVSEEFVKEFRALFLENRAKEIENDQRMDGELHSGDDQVRSKTAGKQLTELESLSANKDLTKLTSNQRMVKALVAVRDNANALRALREKK